MRSLGFNLFEKENVPPAWSTSLAQIAGVIYMICLHDDVSPVSRGIMAFLFVYWLQLIKHQTSCAQNRFEPRLLHMLLVRTGRVRGLPRECFPHRVKTVPPLVNVIKLSVISDTSDY